MENLIENILKDLSSIKYSKNIFNSKLHEDKIELVLVKNGFKKLNKQGLPSEKEIYYIKQPNGSQRSPDFTLVVEGVSVNIECKSAQTGYKPMWNCSYPDQNTIYVYTNKRNNHTILFLGNEIITDDVQVIYDEYREKHKQLCDEINNKLKNLDREKNPYALRVYNRNMFIQGEHLYKKNSSIYMKNIREFLKKILK